MRHLRLGILLALSGLGLMLQGNVQHEINFLSANQHEWRLTADNSNRLRVAMHTGIQGGVRFTGTGTKQSGNDWEGAFWQFGLGESEADPSQAVALPVGGIVVLEWEWRAQDIQSQATYLQVGLYRSGKVHKEGSNPDLGKGIQARYHLDTGSNPVTMRSEVRYAAWQDAGEFKSPLAEAPAGWGRNETRTLRLFLERTHPRELRIRFLDVTAGVRVLAEEVLSGDFPEELDTVMVAMRRSFAAGGNLDRFIRFTIRNYLPRDIDLQTQVLRTGAVLLEWDYDDRYAAGEEYQVYRRVVGEEQGKLIGKVQGRRFVDRETLQDQQYEYRVVGLNLDQKPSAMSTIKPVTVQQVYSAVALNRAAAILRGDALQLRWETADELRGKSVRVYSETKDEEPLRQEADAGKGNNDDTKQLENAEPVANSSHRKHLIGEYPISALNAEIKMKNLSKSQVGDYKICMTVVSPEGEESGCTEVEVTGYIPRIPHRKQPQEHPFLLLNSEEIAYIKGRIAEDSQYRLFYRAGMEQDTENAWQLLSEHKGKLPKERQTKFHSSICTALHQLALAYVFTDQEKYADLVRELLLEYASFYADIPIVRPWADGHLTGQTLNEAMIFVSLIWAYDLTYHTFNEQQRQVVEERLFREAVRCINRRDRGFSNWQAWHNAATLAIGYVLKDPDIWQPVLDGPRGFLYLLENSVLKDGMWYEQSVAYHYFTLHSLTLMAEIAYRQGYDLYHTKVGQRSLKLLYDGPFYHAMSNLDQPPFGDSDPGQSLVAPWVAWNYAFAYGHYQDPKYKWLWEFNNIIKRRPQGTRMPPLLCLPYLEKNSLAEEKSAQDGFVVRTGNPLPGVRNLGGNSILEVTGMAVMRGSNSTPDPESAVIWKPEGTVAGHQHPNNLGLYWKTAAHRWISSSGKWAGYATDIHTDWVKQTISDNTLVVDRKSQYPAFDGASSWRKDDPGKPSSGVLRAFLANRCLTLAEVETDKVYEGVTINRRFYNTDSYSLDVMSAVADRPRTYDWVVHISGEHKESNLDMASREQPLASSGGYTYIREIKETDLRSTWQTSWVEAEVAETLHVTALAGEGWSGYIGRSPWAYGKDRSALIVSAKQKDAVFISALRGVADGEEDPVKQLSWIGERGNAERGAIEVAHSEGTDGLFWSEQPLRNQWKGQEFQGRNVWLRLDDQDQLQLIALSDSTLLKTQQMNLAMEMPADWSIQWLQSEVWVLTYQDIYSNHLTLPDAEQWVCWLLDQQAQPEREIERTVRSEGRIGWNLEPSREYLFYPKKLGELNVEILSSLKPMQKEFRYRGQ